MLLVYIDVSTVTVQPLGSFERKYKPIGKLPNQARRTSVFGGPSGNIIASCEGLDIKVR